MDGKIKCWECSKEVVGEGIYYYTMDMDVRLCEVCAKSKPQFDGYGGVFH